ncbi:MAG: hypothetical protein AAFY71_07835 [Bacteroidota bacterium]
MYAISHTQLVGINLVPGQLRYSLENQPLLQGRRIRGIIAHPSGGSTLEGKSTIDPSNVVLNLRDNQNDIRQEWKLDTLLIAAGTPLLHFIPLDLKNINWQKSYIEFPQGSVIVANTAVLLTIAYDRK